MGGGKIQFPYLTIKPPSERPTRSWNLTPGARGKSQARESAQPRHSGPKSNFKFCPTGPQSPRALKLLRKGNLTSGNPSDPATVRGRPSCPRGITETRCCKSAQVPPAGLCIPGPSLPHPGVARCKEETRGPGSNPSTKRLTALCWATTSLSLSICKTEDANAHLSGCFWLEPVTARGGFQRLPGAQGTGQAVPTKREHRATLARRGCSIAYRQNLYLEQSTKTKSSISLYVHF